MLDLEVQIRPLAGALTPSIMELVSQLCEPDPKRRGHPKNIGSLVPQHNLERFISAFNVLASKAELNII